MTNGKPAPEPKVEKKPKPKHNGVQVPTSYETVLIPANEYTSISQDVYFRDAEQAKLSTTLVTGFNGKYSEVLRYSQSGHRLSAGEEIYYLLQAMENIKDKFRKGAEDVKRMLEEYPELAKDAPGMKRKYANPNAGLRGALRGALLGPIVYPKGFNNDVNRPTEVTSIVLSAMDGKSFRNGIAVYNGKPYYRARVTIGERPIEGDVLVPEPGVVLEYNMPVGCLPAQTWRRGKPLSPEDRNKAEESLVDFRFDPNQREAVVTYTSDSYFGLIRPRRLVIEATQPRNHSVNNGAVRLVQGNASSIILPTVNRHYTDQKSYDAGLLDGRNDPETKRFTEEQIIREVITKIRKQGIDSLEEIIERYPGLQDME